MFFTYILPLKNKIKDKAMIQKLKIILPNKQNDEENDKNQNDPIRTSATIKQKNYDQIKKYAEQFNIPIYQFGILCLEYFIKQNHSKLEKKSGTVEYNKDDDYKTLPIIYEDHEKYELFLSLRIINRLSVSYLMDTAIEMYLSMIIEMLLEKM